MFLLTSSFFNCLCLEIPNAAFSVYVKRQVTIHVFCALNSNICIKQSTDLRGLLIVHPSSKFNRQLYIVHFLCVGTAVAPFIIRAWFSCRSSLLPIHSLGR